ncbi:MFS transporter [Leifsonia shinshuensis]|uniref:MFS transporter n=1 Tax=Leifsonia shinshuensis TaxID=150026 RepID=UPI00285C90CA|nr:MFS transporter [Leifsonia shinshuensis]MDR6972117.1 putative MFS family arabinose efflux permease [Leifsonia shinshuensis]
MDVRRPFALLWISQALSQFGTSVSSLAYPLLILELTGSAAQAGLVGAVVAVAGLVTRLPAGSLADRRPPRPLMLAADAARAILLAVLAVSVSAGLAGIGPVLVVVGLEVCAGAVFGPAEFRLLRAISAPEERAIAVGRMQSRSQLAGLLGPLAGGVLFGIAPWLPFAVDALSYAASFALVAALPRAASSVDSGAGAVPGRERKSAWRWLRRDGFLLPAALWVAALTATFSAVGLIVIVVAQDRGAGSAAIGLMSSISAAGGLAGALLTPAIQRRLRPGAVFRLAALVDTAATVALLPLQSPVLIGVAGAVAFFSAPVVAASLFGEVSVRVPDALVGRAQSSMVLVVGLLAPVTPVLAGLVLDRSGSTGGIIACATVFAVLTVVSLVLPAFRRAAADAR